MLERFAPAYVVVNRDGDVRLLLRRGPASTWRRPPGQPSRQLLAMARKGLRLDLRGALQEAVETRRPVVARADRGRERGRRVQLIDLTVEPLPRCRGGSAVPGRCSPTRAAADAARRRRCARPRGAGDGAAWRSSRRELRETRERLQSTIEEYETALEELKAANEELVSMNEELQSTNEELETTKEELQSVNEELQTVNQELDAKVEQLNQANCRPAATCSRAPRSR